MTQQPSSPDRRRLLLGLGGLALAGVADGWIGHAVADPARMRIGDQRGNVQALLTASGAAAALPYPVEWPQFAAAAPLLEAMNAGALDLGFVGDAPFSFAAAAGTPMKAVAAFETTGDGEGALSILVRKDSAIRSPVDLAGKRIATTRGSVGHYLLLFVLDKAGIDQSAVSIAFLAPNDGKSALDGGSVDAWSVWDPYVAIAELEGSTRSIANARALYPGFGFLIASDTAIAGKRAQIADFIGPMNRAYDWRRTHVAEFAKVFSAETGLPDAVAVAMLTHTQYRSVPIDDQVVAGVQAIIDVYARHRVVPARVDLSGCFDRSF